MISPVVAKIIDNLTTIKKKYEGSEKAEKIRNYIQQCHDKLKAKNRDDLVLELHQALNRELNYAKTQAAKAKDQVKSYLRGPAKPDNSFDDSGGRPAAEVPASPSPRKLRLPFREDTNHE